MAPHRDDIARYCAESNQMRAGHRMNLLVGGGRAFPAMLEAIEAAEASVWLESYIFDSDDTGRSFVVALSEAARRGLDVLVLLDAFGALGLSAEDEDMLLDAGAQLRYFGRFNNLRFERWIQRDHRKQLIIDGQQAFVGGLNFNDDYNSRQEGGRGWHDFMVRVEGPAVAELEELYLDIWNQLGPPAQPSYKAQSHGEGESAMVVGSDRKIRFRIRRHILHALRQAQREILIASAYFVPDSGIQRALIKAAQRGIVVRLLVPADSDIPGAQWAGEHSYDRLLKCGVNIHLWTQSHMHAKALVVDRAWAAVGSYNLDYVSLFLNLELMVAVVGETTPGVLADELTRNFAASPGLAEAAWNDRPVHHRLRSALAYQFRRWL